METKLGDERIKARKRETLFKQLPRGRRDSREYQMLQQTGEHPVLSNVEAAAQLHIIAAIWE